MTGYKGSRRVKVFLSHSVVDTDFARQVRNLLSASGNARVFTTEELNAGENWESRLRDELAGADVVVALLTPNAFDSWALQEIGAAWALQKPIIPVVTRRDVLNRMPLALEGTQFLEVKGLDTPKSAGDFVQAFENTLAAAHIG